MTQIDSNAAQWLSKILDAPYKATKHTHSHQDEVYKIETTAKNYYLKLSTSLRAERDNLKRLQTIVRVPRVIDFYVADTQDYLLVSELPGKNLVELIGVWPDIDIVNVFAQAVRRLHRVDVLKVFPEAHAGDVLLHGDMALPNIIMSVQNRIGYIDFGQLSFGPPELDLVDAIWSLQRNMGLHYGELFLEKYGPVQRTPKIKAALTFKYLAP